jgi:hypothetical protein
MLYSYYCQNSDISFAVQQVCIHVLRFCIHLIVLNTVIRASRLPYLQYSCSSRHNYFCLVIFLFFTSQTSPLLKLFIMNEKTEYCNLIPNMALDAIPACHTFQTRFYNQES